MLNNSEKVDRMSLNKITYIKPPKIQFILQNTADVFSCIISKYTFFSNTTIIFIK